MVEPEQHLHLTPIEHVVIVVKENHGFDNYFGTFPGADGMAMAHSKNPPRTDPDHRHPAWLTRTKTAPRVQFVEGDIPVYWAWARAFTLCDSYFTDVAGPSTPNHLMLVAADSPIIENPHPAPLFDMRTLPAQLDQSGMSWGNYGGYVFDYIKYTAGKQKAPAQFAVDAAAGRLPAVSWLYADNMLSEHPADTDVDLKAGFGNVTRGSAWTAAQVAAVVKGGLWPKTAIFVTWDDWGGWYDHVNPPEVEKWTDGTQFRFGGRVPCLVLSPYAKAGFISHARHSHVSLVRFCENTFGLPSLNARTAADDGMVDCFDWKQKPLAPPG
jgi:phospholipase C